MFVAGVSVYVSWSLLAACGGAPESEPDRVRGGAVDPPSLAPVSVQIANRFTSGPEHAHLDISVPLVGPGSLRAAFTDISATLFYLEDDIRSSSITLFVGAAGLSAGSAERDSILAFGPEWLDAANHPRIRFQSRATTPDASGALTVRGDLTIKGITHQAVILAEPPPRVVSLENGMETTDFRGTLSFARSDYGLGAESPWNSTVTELPVVLGDTVHVSFDIQVYRSTFEWLRAQVEAPLPDGSRHPVSELYDVTTAEGVERALLRWDEMRTEDPSLSPRTVSNLGWLLNLSGRPNEAVQAYDVMLASSPEDVNTHYRRGDALTTAGRYEEAIEEYRHLLEQLPASGHLHHLLALLDRDPITGAESSGG